MSKTLSVWTLVALTPILRADEVVTVDNRGYFGTVKSLTSGVIMLDGRFLDKGKGRNLILTINVSRVRSIEFNFETDNSGPPPPGLAVRPEDLTATRIAPKSKAVTSTADAVILFGNDKKNCRVIAIDRKEVKCAKGEMTFPRGNVHLIRFAPE